MKRDMLAVGLLLLVPQACFWGTAPSPLAPVLMASSLALGLGLLARTVLRRQQRRWLLYLASASVTIFAVAMAYWYNVDPGIGDTLAVLAAILFQGVVAVVVLVVALLDIGQPSSKG